jgi:DNA-binding transcriptional MerR regulator
MTNIYLLKDVAKISGQSVYTLKYYLKLGLIKEIGRSPDTNFRFFDDSTVDALAKIREMKLKNISLKEIKNLLTHSTAESGI